MNNVFIDDVNNLKEHIKILEMVRKDGLKIQYIQNPVDTGIESYEDYEKHNKKFIPSWNLKHLLSPFSGEGKSKNKK